MNLFHTRLLKHENGNFAIAFGNRSLSVHPSVVQRYRNLEQYCQQPLIAGLRPEAFGLADANSMVDDQIQVDVLSREALGHEHLIYTRAPISIIQDDDNSARSSRDLTDCSNQQNSSLLIARVSSSHAIHPDTSVNLTVDMSQLYLFTADGQSIDLKL